MSLRAHGCFDVDWSDVDPQPNPPVQYQEATDLVDGLGTALALGALADKAGFPAGTALVADVKSFVATHLSDDSAESGGVLGSAFTWGGKVASAVGKKAVAVLEALERSPAVFKAIVAGGVVYGLGSQWLSSDAQEDLARLSAQTQLVSEAAANMTPSERSELARSLLGDIAGGGAGPNVWAWLGLGAGLLGLYLVYKLVRP